MKPELILVGGGGHCRSVIDAIEEADIFRIEGIVDVKENVGKDVLGYPVIGTDGDLEKLVRRYTFFLVTLGQIKTYAPRLRIYEMLKNMGAIMASIVSPTAYVSKHAHIGPGTVVLHGATVNAGAEIGENCIINSHALIEHDAVIGSHCHISTGAIINGGARVGDRTFIGSGSVLRQEIKVGNGCVVQTGSLFIKDIEADSVFKGSKIET
ncbi:acetyltransferase [Desulforegula conservatrix]|uniref:acetyltransferase n=1 Tax=Desulforegula conservatrix TaxID=153026 RepID=UPI00042A6CB9|nr:acetyltransferase [Desulforegula conservatrix]